MTMRPIYSPILFLISFFALVGCDSGSDDTVICTDGDQTYSPGDTWTCSDGCNDCSCGDNGSIASTDLDCSGFCTDEDCGPAPGMPNYLCDDGVTTAGPAGCELQNDGECGWTIIQCPSTDPCDDLDCWPCVNGECLPEDEVCEPGETFDAADGCNTCECPDSGLVAEAACTEMACETACGSADDCEPNEFCDFVGDTCGLWINTTMAGTCQVRPESCDEGGPGACGCNGTYRTNDCELQSNGTDYQKYGGCLEPVATPRFRCGDINCDPSTERCSLTQNDAVGPGEPEFYAFCLPLVEECQQGDCSCISVNSSSECFNINGYTFVVDLGE